MRLVCGPSLTSRHTNPLTGCAGAPLPRLEQQTVALYPLTSRHTNRHSPAWQIFASGVDSRVTCVRKVAQPQTAQHQVRVSPAWKCVHHVEGPSHPDTPTLSRATPGASFARLDTRTARLSRRTDSSRTAATPQEALFRAKYGDGGVGDDASTAVVAAAAERRAAPSDSLWVYSTSHRPHSHDIFALAVCPGAPAPDPSSSSAPSSSSSAAVLVSGGMDTKLCAYSIDEFARTRPR